MDKAPSAPAPKSFIISLMSRRRNSSGKVRHSRDRAEWKNPYIFRFEYHQAHFCFKTKSCSISTVEGSGATSARICIELFFKNRCFAKNALTSHYANGHGDPSDKWVKNHATVTTGHQVNFLKGLGSFHTCQYVWGVWKIPKSIVI